MQEAQKCAARKRYWIQEEESHNRQHVGKWYPRKAASGARVSGFWDAVFQLSLLLLSA